MLIVIDIPEEEYKCVKITGCVGNNTCISNAIYNGTPLPNALEYLETAYTGARACDDVAEQVRLARAIEAYKHDVHEDFTVLDKIRAEILAYDYLIGHNAQVRWCLSIIDKYREEQNYDKGRNS